MVAREKAVRQHNKRLENGELREQANKFVIKVGVGWKVTLEEALNISSERQLTI